MEPITTVKQLEDELAKVEKLYQKGVITYAEFVMKQADLIHLALYGGVTWDQINNM